MGVNQKREYPSLNWLTIDNNNSWNAANFWLLARNSKLDKQSLAKIWLTVMKRDLWRNFKIYVSGGVHHHHLMTHTNHNFSVLLVSNKPGRTKSLYTVTCHVTCNIQSETVLQSEAVKLFWHLFMTQASFLNWKYHFESPKLLWTDVPLALQNSQWARC